jgi:hypothetical protein
VIVLVIVVESPLSMRIAGGNRRRMQVPVRWDLGSGVFDGRGGDAIAALQDPCSEAATVSR